MIVKYLLMIACLFGTVSCKHKQTFAEKIPKMEIIHKYYHTQDTRWQTGVPSPLSTQSRLGHYYIPMKDLLGRTLYVYSGEQNKKDSIKLILKRAKQLRKGMSEEQVVHILKPTYYGKSLSSFCIHKYRYKEERDFYMNDYYQDLLFIDGKLGNINKFFFIDIEFSDVPFSGTNGIPKLLVNGDKLQIKISVYSPSQKSSDNYILKVSEGAAILQNYNF